MALKNSSKIAFWLLAIVLVVDSATESCLAEEVHSEAPAPRAGPPLDSAWRFGDHPGAAIDDVKFQGNKAAEQSSMTNSENAATGDQPLARDALDIRMAVPPHQLRDRQNAPGQVKTIASSTWRNLLGRHPLFRGRSDDLVRNPIAIPVLRREGFEQRPRQPGDLSIIAHGTVLGATNVDGSVSGRFAKGEGRAIRGTTNANPTAASNRGTINGTGLTRAGSGASTLGGPAKAVARIDGATIRPKH